MPFDVRKASGLPKDECHHEFKLARLRLANLRRREKDGSRKGKAFPHIGRPSRTRDSLLLDGLRLVA